MRRRRDAVVLTVSFLAHLALLVAWMSTRPDLPPAESPTMNVELARLPPRTLPEPAKAAPHRPSRQPAPPNIHRPTEPEAQPSVPPLVAPEWRVKPDTPSAGDLAAAPFASGRPRPAARQALRPGCKTQSWDRPVDCPPDTAELAASKAEAANDSKTAGFESAGAYKRAQKAYHEAPGGAGYPGIACAIFHKC